MTGSAPQQGGSKEIWRSSSEAAFAHPPALGARGVQRIWFPAWRRYGCNREIRMAHLVDDFLPAECYDMIHVHNALSPAATSSLATGNHIASRLSPLTNRRLFTRS